MKAKYISSDEESAPGSWDKWDYNYEYNAQDQLVKTISTQENKYDSFNWSNDNMTSYKTGIYEPISGNITYSGTQNNANIDLAYFVCFFNSTESLAFPHGVERGTLSGFFGKRTANMPETIVEGSDKLTFEYKVNAEGYVYEVLITDSYDSSETSVVIEYMN